MKPDTALKSGYRLPFYSLSGGDVVFSSVCLWVGVCDGAITVEPFVSVTKFFIGAGYGQKLGRV